MTRNDLAWSQNSWSIKSGLFRIIFGKPGQNPLEKNLEEETICGDAAWACTECTQTIVYILTQILYNIPIR